MMAGTASTNDRLNLRSDSNAQATVLEILDKGTQVNVIDTQGDWVHVQAPDGQIGYVSAAYVTLSDPATTPLPVSSAPTSTASSTGTKLLVAAPTSSQLNVRSSPQVVSDPSNVIEQIAAGATLIPMESDASVAAKIGTMQAQNQWIQIQTPSGKTGYAAAWFVQYLTTPAVPIQTTVTVTTTNTGTPPVVTVAVQPVSGAASLPGDLDSYFAWMAQQPPESTPTIDQGYYDFQGLAGQIGLPTPFDMLPTQQSNDSIRDQLIVNGFGPNSFAQQHWQGWYSNTDGMHNGLDHIVPTGTPLLAVSEGVIVGTEQNWKFLGSSDKCVILWPFMPPSVVDGQGRRMMSNVLVAYAHLSDNSKVQRHQIVKAGDVIGLSGFPGTDTTNAHLHLEVHLITGDNSLPVRLGGHPLADYPNPQPFGAISPFNPILFFSERMVRMHLRVGKKGNGGMPSYPNNFDFFSIGQYQYSPGLVIWNHLNQSWPDGIYDMPTLVQRARSYASFQPVTTDFLNT